MPRKKLRRLLARLHDPQRDHSLRRLFGTLLHNRNLWHLNRHSVAWGVSVGLFMSFVPVPAQMVLAAALAILIGCNLPIAVVMVWVSNPITIAPLFFAAYKLGAWLLDVPPQTVKFELSYNWLMNELGAIWEPFLLGSFALALMSAAAGQVAVRVIWRIHVTTSWRERQLRRRRRAARAGRATDRPREASARGDTGPGKPARPEA